MAPGMWLALLMFAYPACVYLPSHLLLRLLFEKLLAARAKTGGH
jgi:hypothetical protein